MLSVSVCWGDYAVEFNKYIRNNDDGMNIVFVCQLSKCTQYQDKYHFVKYMYPYIYFIYVFVL